MEKQSILKNKIGLIFFGLIDQLSGQYSQRQGIKHVLVIELLPFPVLGEVDFKLREAGHQDSRRILLAGPAVAADGLPDGVGGIGDDFEFFSFPDGLDFISQNIEKGRIAVVGEKGFFHREDLGPVVFDQAENNFAAGLQGLMGRHPFFDRFDSEMERRAIFQKGDAHMAGPGIDGQNPGTLTFGHLIHNRTERVITPSSPILLKFIFVLVIAGRA
jgi:hypothetical protein